MAPTDLDPSLHVESVPRGNRGNMLPANDSLSSSGQKARKHRTRNISDQGIDQPGEYCGNGSTQPDGFNLDICTAILLFNMPIVVQTPQVAVVISWGKFMFVRLVKIVDLGNPRGIRLAQRSGGTEHRIVHIEVRVDRHGYNRLPIELQKDPEVVPSVFQQLRAPNVRLIYVLV